MDSCCVYTQVIAPERSYHLILGRKTEMDEDDLTGDVYLGKRPSLNVLFDGEFTHTSRYRRIIGSWAKGASTLPAISQDCLVRKRKFVQ